MGSPLPTGTVAFLFTDIQGSTQLWQRHPAAMPEALARHHVLLTKAIESHGGYVFQIIGDAFCGAFHTVRDGLQAAVAAQRLLRDAEWGATGPIRVRMALHAGAAEVNPGQTTSGEYVSGITLSRAARLLSSGHGGQVLLSLPAAELVRDHLPDGLSFIDLGAHRLKDLVRPEQIYQAVASDLPADFPALKTLDSLPHNLPVQLTSFIGREKELNELSALLPSLTLFGTSPPFREGPGVGSGAGRLLTLVGPGGTGKTRLALQLAAEHIDSFPDGAWLVDLSALDDPRLIPAEVAAAWALREQPGYPYLDTLKDFLRHKQLLLILDNCEHLVEACARLCRDLLLTAPGLHLLATSREPLGVSGEMLYRLATLSVPDLKALPPIESLTAYDSVRLFIDRAQLVQPAFAINKANAPSVAQICTHLDGIPLAIELAAARVRVFTPEQINARLGDRFRLLTGGSRTSLPRQQTLQAAIDWSHDLLSEPEKMLFRRLSVFHGGWTFEMAEAVCPGDGLEAYDLLDLLPSLVDRSLVTVDELPGGMRYRLLDTLRAYSHQKLVQAEEETAYLTRHLDAFLHWASEKGGMLGDARQLDALNALESEHDNLRAALEIAIHQDSEKALSLLDALWVFWFMHGHFVEARRRIEQAFQAAEGLPIPDEVRSRALCALAAFRYFQGEPGIAHSAALEGLELARRIGDREAELIHLHHIGIAQDSLNDKQGAIQTLEAAILLARVYKDEHHLTWLINDLATIIFGHWDLDRAEALLHEDTWLLRKNGDYWGLGYTLNNLADIAIHRGQFTEAEAMLFEAGDILSRYGDPLGYSGILFTQSELIWLRGDFFRSHALFLESLEIERNLGRLHYIPSLAERLAMFMADNGGAQQAAILLGSAHAYRLAGQYPTEPSDEQAIRKASNQATLMLGEAVFEAVYKEGEFLTIEQAIQRAFSPL